MKFHKSLTTVTPVSKSLAMVLFIFLPFFGFYLGVEYGKTTTSFPTTNLVTKHTTPITKTPTPTITYTWKEYKNDIFGFSFKYNPTNGAAIIEKPSSYSLNQPTLLSIKLTPESGTDSFLDVVIYTNSENLPLQAWYTKYLPSLSKKFDLSNITTSKKQINGNEFVEITSNSLQPSLYFIKKDSVVPSSQSNYIIQLSSTLTENQLQTFSIFK